MKCNKSCLLVHLTLVPDDDLFHTGFRFRADRLRFSSRRLGWKCSGGRFDFRRCRESETLLYSFKGAMMTGGIPHLLCISTLREISTEPQQAEGPSITARFSNLRPMAREVGQKPFSTFSTATRSKCHEVGQ